MNWIMQNLVQSPHGRAAAVATGIKHMQKDKLVYSYQGDGDAAGIGLAETFHAASCPIFRKRRQGNAPMYWILFHIRTEAFCLM